jgi:hypothetical protein
MSPEEKTSLGWFAFTASWAFTAFWAFMSATAMTTMVHEERSRWAAWLWACSFGVSSPVAA